jgi:hypothetical protein
MAQRWGGAFSEEYQAATAPDDAVADIAAIEAMKLRGRARSTCGSATTR